MHDMDDKRPSASESLRAILARLFVQAEQAVLLADGGRRICFVNPAALSLFGCQESQMIGHKASDFFTEAQALPSNDVLQASADLGQGYRRYLGRRRRGDGSTFDAQTLVATIRDPRHEELLYIEVVHDVSIWSCSDQVLHALRRVVFDPGLPFDERRRALLAFGCEHFGTPYGAISELVDDELTIIDATGPDDGFHVGDAFNRGDTYCDHAIERNAPFRRDGLTYKRVPPRRYGDRVEVGCYIGCPIPIGRRVYGTLYFAAHEADGLFDQADLDLVAALAQWVGQEIEIENSIALLKQAREQFGRETSPDALADLSDRDRLKRQLQAEIDRARSRQEPVSVALLAVDDFERLDEQHGEGAGEAALDHVTALCNETLRASDHVGRWADNELLLLLPDTSRAQALVTIERLLQALRGQRMVNEALPVNITASAGVAESGGEDSAQIILHRADIARHLARSNGRDRVEAG